MESLLRQHSFVELESILEKNKNKSSMYLIHTKNSL